MKLQLNFANLTVSDIFQNKMIKQARKKAGDHNVLTVHLHGYFENMFFTRITPSVLELCY